MGQKGEVGEGEGPLEERIWGWMWTLCGAVMRCGCCRRCEGGETQVRC